MERYWDALLRYLAHDGLSDGPRFVGVPQCIHNNVGEFLYGIFVLHVGVFVEDEKQVHEVAPGAEMVFDDRSDIENQ